MKKIIIGWIFLIINLQALSFANPDFEVDHYDFLADFKEVSFKIKSEEINGLVQQKLLLEKPIEIFVEVKWSKNELNSEVRNIGELSEKSQNSIREVFENKYRLVVRGKFQEWIKDFEPKKADNPKIQNYEDETGLLDRSEISLEEKDNKIILIEKIPTGNIVTEYIYAHPPWSGGRKVLTRVVRKKTEENQKEETENFLIYEKLANRRWMLSKLQITTTQQLNTKSEKPINRKITELFSFYDYKMKI